MSLSAKTATAKTATADGAAGDLEGMHRPVVIVGGGQAGLSMSHCLTHRSVEHIVLERDRVGHEWRNRRWDSFCLVTPNWQCQLPGFPYAGDEPDGFMGREEIVRYLEDYAKSFRPPVLEGVAATRLRRDRKGRYLVGTHRGELIADQVVLATGPYQVPLIPRLAEGLPEGLQQLHSSGYRNPEQLPPGEVLVVGTGQSGCQIAEDLHLAGRRVHLAVGSAPRVARFYRGRDVVAWLDAMGYYRKAVSEFADADAVRFRVNHYVTGRDGGRDIDLRAFAREGMRLYGRLTGVNRAGASGAGASGARDSGATVRFAPDLEQNLDHADAVSESIKDAIDSYIDAHGIDAAPEPRYTPVWRPERQPTQLDLGRTGITSVIWSTGFGRDDRWIEVPVFDGRGYPTHDRGVTSSPGLYVLGLPWQHTWGSARLSGVAEDAGYLAERITTGAHRRPAPAEHLFRWIAGTSMSTYPRDDEWVAPRTVA